MSDWEQRLRLYAGSSSQRSTSPLTASPSGAADSAVRERSESLAQQRARSPNALERLRASTAMNLVALELRRAEASKLDAGGAPKRTSSPLLSTGVSYAGGRTTVPPREASGWGPSDAGYSDQRAASPTILGRTSSVAGAYTMQGVSSGRTPLLASGAHQPPRGVSPPLSRSTYGADGGFTSPRPMPPTQRATSPQRAHTGGLPFTASITTSNVAAPNASVMADSFNPQTILQMLETKIRTLETRNAQLESSVQVLSARNDEMASVLAEAEAKIQSQVSALSNAQALQHEVVRLREELVNAAQREERRVEDMRRRMAQELDEERRHSAARDHELHGLRNAIRQLATIERSVES